MKLEICAVSLLRISPRAQKLFLDLFGGKMTAVDFDLTRYLAQPGALEDLREYFQCHQDEVFSELVEKIDLDVLEKPASVVFTRKHIVNILDQTKVILYLTDILQCDKNEIFDELFDIPRILDYIYNISPQVVKQWMLVHVRDDRWAPSGKLIFKHLLQANIPRILNREWGRFLDDNMWLRSTAMARIRGALSDQGYIATTDSKSLATIIEESFYRDEHSAVHLDSLAVLHIQRQIAWVVRQMIDHAIEQLDDALNLSNSKETLANLHRHLNAYELKRPAAVWSSILSFTVVENAAKLTELMAKFPSVTFLSTGLKGVPEVGVKMIARLETDLSASTGQRFWSSRGKKPDLQIVVACKITNKAELVDVLTCKLIDPSQVGPFMQVLSGLQFTSVEDDSAFDIGDFVLSRNGSSTIEKQMKYLLSKLRLGIIQGMILTGCDTPNHVAFVWDRDLEYQLPIPNLQHRRDAKFPLDRSQILQLIQDDLGIPNAHIMQKMGQ